MKIPNKPKIPERLKSILHPLTINALTYEEKQELKSLTEYYERSVLRWYKLIDKLLTNK